MFSVAVTGSHGFLGQYAYDTAINHPAVKNVIRVDRTWNDTQLKAALADVRVIMHYAGVLRSDNPLDFYEGNVVFTHRILSALPTFQYALPLFWNAGTTWVDDPERRATPYAITKAAAEGLVVTAGIKDKLIARCPRMPNVFGSRCQPNKTSIVATLCAYFAGKAEEEFVLVNNGMDERNFMHVRHVVDEMRVMLDEYADYQRTGLIEGGCEPIVGDLCRWAWYPLTIHEMHDKIASFAASGTTLDSADLLSAFDRDLYYTYLTYLPKEQQDEVR